MQLFIYLFSFGMTTMLSAHAFCHFWLCAVVVQQCRMAHFDQSVFAYTSLDALTGISEIKLYGSARIKSPPPFHS